LVLYAATMALWRRGKPTSLLQHSCQGSQSKNGDVTRWVAEIVRLIEAAERILETEGRTTLPLTFIRRKAAAIRHVE
jgi:hypothetical protein